MRCLGLLLVAGCSGNITTAFIAFESPSSGASFTRDQLGSTGALMSPVEVKVTAEGDIARVAISEGEDQLGDVDGDGKLVAEVTGKGATTLVATAYDDDDAALATATVDIMLADPQLANCHEWLDLYKQQYTLGPDNPGVADPVTATVPINGLSYRYTDNTTPRKTLYADCTLIRSLLEAAPIMRKRDIVEVADIGIYNYRCIGSTGTPPDCPSGISQHAYAKAIDLAAFKQSDGSTYTVLTDWVIDGTGATCSADTEPGKDAFLHELICALKQAKVWNIVLTPNYNSDHRNHFHVDLTPDSNFIKREVFDYDD
jgi:hypothetical protein